MASTGRLVLIPLESRWGRLVVLGMTVVAATWLGGIILRPAVAEYRAAHATTVEALERALAWDPQNPALHLGLGGLYESLAQYDRARAQYDMAHKLRPTDAHPWLRLALLADHQGRRSEAHEALDAALRSDPHNVGVRWEAALLAYQWGERARALEHLRYVLAVDPAQRDAAFQLARVLLEPEEDPSRLLPSEPDGLSNILVAAVSHEDLPLAEAAWTRRASLAPPLPEQIGRGYLQLLLDHGQGRVAREVWRTLQADRTSRADANAVWNGGFEADQILGWGLDWRVQRMWGVDVTLDRFVAARGKHSLRLTFNSFPTLDFGGVWQLVPVEPGREYRLRALAKATDFTTRSGLKLQAVLPDSDAVIAQTNAIAGSTDDWVPLEALVRIPPEASLIRLRLRREPSPGPDGNLGGKVWVDEVRLE